MHWRKHNNNRGAGVIGVGVLGEIENSPFLKVNMDLLYIYVNSDVTDTFTFELWFC